jgi:putative transposase
MIFEVIGEAQRNGARLSAACHVLGISARTLERWRGRPDGDDRRVGPHRRAANALTQAEEARVLAVMESERYGGLSPKQLVPQLADEGLYLASESTMYRLQRRHGMSRRKRRATRSQVTRSSTTHRATAPNQVWSWDITWLPTVVRGRFLFLYLVMDVWSRRIVGWTVATRESPDIAAELIQRVCRNDGIDPRGLVLHSDNGKPMRGATMVSTLQWLGIVPSFSRPHVSNDNPYSEALFRTLKHAPTYPRMPFVDANGASRWVASFVDWYNSEHRHSAIRYVTPDERHYGHERDVLAARSDLYSRARAANPERWTRSARDWSPVGLIVLNPEPQPTAAT